MDRSGNTVAERFTLSCDLRQGRLSLPGLENTLTDAFVEISYLDGAARMGATAFTLAHFFTLAANAIGDVTLPSRPVEILIAGSIILLGVEILRKHKGVETLGATRTYLIALA